jgi:hypothetical protein
MTDVSVLDVLRPLLVAPAGIEKAGRLPGGRWVSMESDEWMHAMEMSAIANRWPGTRVDPMLRGIAAEVSVAMDALVRRDFAVELAAVAVAKLVPAPNHHAVLQAVRLSAGPFAADALAAQILAICPPHHRRAIETARS